MNEEEPYESLRRALNQYPLRVPRSKKFLKLLKMLYSEDEAKILSQLGLPYIYYDKIQRIAKRNNISEEILEEMFQKMVDKGTLFFKLNERGKKSYCLPPFIPGIYEFYTMSKNDPPELKKEILKLLEEYYFEVFGPEVFHGSQYPFFRVLPNNQPIEKTIEINQQVDTSTKILPFEVANSYIKSAKYIAVGDCACRMHAEAQDGERRCNKPINVCMVFDDVARYWAEKGIGRLVSYEEAEAVLQEAAKGGCVHCTTNSQEFDPNVAGMICNCCSCCCFILQGLIKTRGKGGLAKSNFEPEIQKEKCKLCLKCISLCPVNALFHHEPHSDDLSDNFIYLNKDECLGCGVCATNCPHDAIFLKKVRDTIPEPQVIPMAKRYENEKMH